MNMHETPLYTSHYEIHRCLLISYLIALGEAILFCIAAMLFPKLFPEDTLWGLAGVILVSTVLLWVCCLRVTYFYEDHFVLFYPLRLFSRKRSFTYDEISSVVFYSGEGRFSEQHLLFLMKNGLKRSCSIEYWSNRQAHKIVYLLRFLKQKGIRIEGHNVQDNDLGDCTEARIEMVFGTGEKHIRRYYETDTKEDSKAFLIFFIILMLFFILLFVLADIIAK